MCAATLLIATLLSKHSCLYSKISAVPHPHQRSFSLQKVGANEVKVLRKCDRPCSKYINYFYEQSLFFKVLFYVSKIPQIYKIYQLSYFSLLKSFLQGITGQWLALEVWLQKVEYILLSQRDFKKNVVFFKQFFAILCQSNFLLSHV